MSTTNFDLGRKIYFINPPQEFQTVIVPHLFNSGYETYILHSYRRLKSLLRKDPNAVCFICIDREMHIDQWHNFVSSFSEEEALSDVLLGVMSAVASPSDKNHFLLHSPIPAGFIDLGQQNEIIHDYIQGILEINEAKGKRNFVRVTCQADNTIGLICQKDSRQFTLKIHNISLAGLLCSIQPSTEMPFLEKSVFSNAALILRNHKIFCNVAVFKTYMHEDRFYIVLLFSKPLSFNEQTTLQAYIRVFLQESINAYLQHLPVDNTDYSKRGTNIAEDEEAFLIEDLED